MHLVINFQISSTKYSVDGGQSIKREKKNINALKVYEKLKYVFK